MIPVALLEAGGVMKKKQYNVSQLSDWEWLIRNYNPNCAGIASQYAMGVSIATNSWNAFKI